MDDRPRHRHSVSFPLFLIAGGIYLLVWNLGLATWSPWQVVTTFWPLLLVGVGLDLLLGRVSGWIAIPLAAVILAALAAGVLALSRHVAGSVWPGKLETTRVSVPLDGATSARLDLDVAGGRLVLGAGPVTDDDIVTGTATTYQGSRLLTSEVRDGDDLHATLRSRRGSGSVGPVIVGGPLQRQRWDLRLRPELPLSLDVEPTAAEARLDLSGLVVPRLDLDLKLSEATLVLPADTAEVAVDARAKLSHLAVTVPEGVAARIRVRSRLATVRVDESRFPRHEGVYESADFEAASRRITVDVDATLSDVTVR